MNLDALKDLVSAILAYSMDKESADRLCENTDFLSRIAFYIKDNCDGKYNVSTMRKAIGKVISGNFLKGE